MPMVTSPPRVVLNDYDDDDGNDDDNGDSLLLSPYLHPANQIIWLCITQSCWIKAGSSYFGPSSLLLFVLEIELALSFLSPL